MRICCIHRLKAKCWKTHLWSRRLILRAQGDLVIFIASASTVRIASANYQFVDSRMPTSESQGFRPPNTTNAWPNGWWGYMQPMCDAFAFVSTTSPGSGWLYNNIRSCHTAFGWKGSGSYPSAAASCDSGDPHDVWYQIPLMAPSNPFQQNSPYTVTCTTTWAGYSPTYAWQSYPSQLQF